MKTSGENEAIYVNYRASRVQCQVCLSIAEAQPIITESNSEFSGGNTGTARFSLYFSPYLVAGQGGKYTKHIYIGSQRIVSKLGDLASYGAAPRRIPYAGNEADGLTIDYKAKYSQQLQSIKDNYKTFDLPYNDKDNDDYVNGQGFCCNDGTPEAAQARAMARTRAASGSSIVSNPSTGESSSDRNSSYHDLKAHISYACICGGRSHRQCGRGKEKGLTPKPKHRSVFPMTGEITSD